MVNDPRTSNLPLADEDPTAEEVREDADAAEEETPDILGADANGA